MEGRVFLCSWKQVPGGYRVWVAKRPKLAAEAATFEEADEELASVICDATGDGESVHEYTPPPPSQPDEAEGLLGRLTAASPNARGEIENGAALFSEGYCTQCRAPRGERTTVALELGKADVGDALSAKLSGAGFSGPRFRLYSADFLAHLAASERANLEFRPVHRRRGKKQFFELSGGSLVVPRVGIRGKPIEGLWTCDTCGFELAPTYLGTWIENHAWSNPPSIYVAKADLPRTLPTCLVVGRASDYTLVFQQARWQELVGVPGTRAVKSQEIGVLGDAWADRTPRRKSLRVAEREARERYG